MLPPNVKTVVKDEKLKITYGDLGLSKGNGFRSGPLDRESAQDFGKEETEITAGSDLHNSDDLSLNGYRSAAD